MTKQPLTHHRNLTPPRGTVWFVGDTHFGHAGSISHTGRPFGDVDEMDRALIEAWNAVVRPGDTSFTSVTSSGGTPRRGPRRSS